MNCSKKGMGRSLKGRSRNGKLTTEDFEMLVIAEKQGRKSEDGKIVHGNFKGKH